MKKENKKIIILLCLVVLFIFITKKEIKIADIIKNKNEENVEIYDEENKESELKEADLKPVSYNAVIPMYMYHWVREDTGNYEYPEMMAKPSEIKKQFEYLSSNNYDTIFITDIDKIYDYKKPIALTFNDGWADVYNNVFPYAKEYNIKISMYVIIDLIGTAGYCTVDELKEMRDSGLVEIESHTMSHRMLATLSRDEIYKELDESKKYIKDTLGIDTTVICYPSGSFNNTVIEIAKELGYKYGLAMDGGVHYTSKTDNMQMTRIFATRSMSLNTFINYASNARVDVKWE